MSLLSKFLKKCKPKTTIAVTQVLTFLPYTAGEIFIETGPWKEFELTPLLLLECVCFAVIPSSIIIMPKDFEFPTTDPATRLR